MKINLILSTLVLLVSSVAVAQPYIITQNDKDRAAELVQQMTLDEKIALISGKEDGFHTYAIERLGIPSVRMADGPQGVRNKTNSTYYPCGIGLAASFSREAAYGVGEGIGLDASARGVRIMLCPGVNIYRSPLCGRNFEYYGEDPCLASEIAASYIQGIQQQRVIATIKHFALNNQEYSRHKTGSLADERTLNELYFPAFRNAIEKADVAAVMTSYNPVNGAHAAENPWLINDNLRQWGFDGIVMSDWKSTYTTLGVLTSGLDLEMPENYTTKPEMVKPLIENGVVPEAKLDLMCRHILQTFIAFGLLDQPAKDESIPEDYEYSRNMAYKAAREAPVLLTNNGILPLKKGLIVVLGPNANTVAFGGGSGRMSPIPGRNITPLAGLQALGKKYKVQYIENTEFTQEERKAIEKANAVVEVMGFNSDTERENADRTYSLPEGQNEFITSVAALNKNTVVIINSGGEVDITPFKDNVAAIIMAWYGGQEGGKALADIISGKVSPSGKLPFTFWGTEEKNPASAYYGAITPEVYNAGRGRDPYPHAVYSEGLFVGYRGVEKFGTKPMFPFGFGLSYSSFAYSDASLIPTPDGCEIVFTVKNTGKADAMESAQVYVAPVNPSVMRPAYELKGFDKKLIAKGKSVEFRIPLTFSDFSYYDVTSHSWKIDAVDYRILIGSSSADIRLTLDYSVK
ncbi:MAG: glycoside hydrolase family 3 C-terminal domain-containing protein [Bacteroidales bacterium]|nr:glycoside hydrolase family 3 C-terminal domain-containing protein [Bacteroidales bacterium]